MIYDMIYDIIYLLTAIGLSPGASTQYTFTHKQYISTEPRIIFHNTVIFIVMTEIFHPHSLW
jgi:hypothetical protein